MLQQEISLKKKKPEKRKKKNKAKQYINRIGLIATGKVEIVSTKGNEKK